MLSNEAYIDSTIETNQIKEICSIMGKTTLLKNQKITRIEPIINGLTNSSFLVVSNENSYIVRIAGTGTSQFINRSAEHKNALIMSELGINCPIYYNDETTGNQISQYIHGKTLQMQDFQNDRKWLQEAAKVLYQVHHAPVMLASKFDLIHEVRIYDELIRSKNLVSFEPNLQCWEKYLEIQSAFQMNPYEEKPCHNDPLPVNWISGEGKLYLVDWEYSGMNDPNFDLAALSLECELSPEEEDYFLRAYYRGDITPLNSARIVIFKFLADYLWSLWAVLQIDNGKPQDEFWAYGINRFQRALAQIEDGSLDQAIAIVKSSKPSL